MLESRHILYYAPAMIPKSNPWPRRRTAAIALALATLAALGRVEEAIASYREALLSSPDLPEAWLNLGILLAARGRTAEAEESLQEALRLRPGLPAANAALERLHRGAPRR